MNIQDNTQYFGPEAPRGKSRSAKLAHGQMITAMQWANTNDFQMLIDSVSEKVMRLREWKHAHHNRTGDTLTGKEREIFTKRINKALKQLEARLDYLYDLKSHDLEPWVNGSCSFVGMVKELSELND
jgi:hypothetical protein